ncbi:MAG: undecaprenyl-diphosphate phosphatase [Candidatus Auribacterota bacterium]|jgi:undecaprenyl-diphosphatase|nr:undecaprenyl-diphosphate phosphatase [Candidatus Auribacterota bacterium]
MDILRALVLGIVQGLTEFLPVSSSGHLVIFQQLILPFDDSSYELLFGVTVHFGTLLAVVMFFFNDIKRLFISFFSKLRNPSAIPEAFQSDMYFRISIYILVSTLITGVVGLYFKDRVESFFSSPSLVAGCLIITGILLIIAERFTKQSKTLDSFRLKDALLLGIFQSIALLPGISRSGMTISVAIMLGFIQKDAARYSFLLAVPVICGAFLLEIIYCITFGFSVTWVAPLSVGLVSAAVSGVIAIKLILLVLRKKKLYVFSIYCWALAGLLLLLLNK